MRQALITSLVEINHMHSTANRLRKPNRGAVANTQIPPRIDTMRRIIRHLSHPTLHLCRFKFLAINRTGNIRIPRTLKFLLILILSHRLPRSSQFLIVKNACLAGLINHAKPIVIAAGLFIQIEKRIVTLRRADKHSPTLAVRQRRADNLWKHILRHLRNLIHHAAIKVNTTQAIRVFSAQQRNTTACRQVTPQFSLVKLNAGDRASKLFQIIPRHVLSLTIGGCHVGIPGVGLGAYNGIPKNVIDGPYRFTKAAVAYDNTPALLGHLIV